MKINIFFFIFIYFLCTIPFLWYRTLLSQIIFVIQVIIYIVRRWITLSKVHQSWLPSKEYLYLWRQLFCYPNCSFLLSLSSKRCKAQWYLLQWRGTITLNSFRTCLTHLRCANLNGVSALYWLQFVSENFVLVNILIKT